MPGDEGPEDHAEKRVSCRGLPSAAIIQYKKDLRWQRLRAGHARYGLRGDRIGEGVSPLAPEPGSFWLMSAADRVLASEGGKLRESGPPRGAMWGADSACCDDGSSAWGFSKMGSEKLSQNRVYRCAPLRVTQCGLFFLQFIVFLLCLLRTR